ncbi:MAG: hypothetical protein CME59_01945 [Halioglobus sp.]|nr:hypothetical protein [Halioglobus sp.]
MRHTCGVVLVLTLVACASGPVTSACPEPRPQVCTMEYNPTCAVLADGRQQEYASPCNACADDQVAQVLTGPCPE